MRYSSLLFRAIFALLIASSIALAVLPWRLHRRFAEWSVPRTTQYLPLIGFASIAGGLGLLAALLSGPAAR